MRNYPGINRGDRVKAVTGFPPVTPARHQSAVLRLDMCDISVEAVLDLLTEVLKPTGARVDWVIVHACPQFRLHYDQIELVQPWHSIFCITTKDGEEVVADFSVKKFGFDEGYWFMNKHEYLVECTTDGKYRPTSEDVIARLVENHKKIEFVYAMIRKMRHVCQELDWDALEDVPNGERNAWVHARALASLKHDRRR
ncbi:hypothetical protein EK21DRAFT_94082 [Setomelanomma holmii]|uniref:Uncharacterized protein n=1 Tax=Setomelanomma holmii TaxID=210430 RepID=A0A9P4LGQ4_9PLEO|nr:hypothetical protein EK21DRAFT_94082 [Setomelanomma holmii]